MSKKTKNILMVIVSVLLVFTLAVFGVKSCNNSLDDEMKQVNLSYEIGGISNTGKYVNSNESICSELFECIGLETKLDFDSNIYYQIYYYDELDNLISATMKYDESKDLDVPSNAVNCRIVITPKYADNLEESKKVVKWYEVYKYAKKLNVYVYKNQIVDTDTNLTFEIDENDEIIITGSMDQTIDKLIIPSKLIKNGIERKVVKIADESFDGLENLKSVTIPSSIKEIGYRAFKGCKLLNEVKLSDGLIIIGGSAFTECDSLTSIVVPSSVKIIDKFAFADNINLSNVVLNEGLESINKFAFDGCIKLTNIVIPSTVIVMGENVFTNCDVLNIYCRAESQPLNWTSTWNADNRPVEWNFKN